MNSVPSRCSSALAAAVLVVAASVVGPSPTAFAQAVMPSVHHAYRAVPVAEGLVNPWSIAFLPGGDMLVTERPGRLRIVRDLTLLPDPVPGVPVVRDGGQGGLLEVLAHPDFERNRLLYFTYSKPNADGSESTTALGRARFENDALVDFEELFEAAAWSQGQGHYGSKLAFDGNGYLYMTVGDRQADPSQNQLTHPAQQRSSHQGSVLRLREDGSVPDDNPFVGVSGAQPEIWSFGHRNPQGLAIDDQGRVWVTEHGPQGGDELNLVRRAANYGWPVVGYGVNYGSGQTLHQGTTAAGMEHPTHFWVPSIGTSGLMFYTGDRFPMWKGNLFAGGLSGLQIARLTLEGDGVASEETLVQGMGRVRDIRQGPDGLIYVAVDDRGGAPTAVVRLEPAQAN